MTNNKMTSGIYARTNKGTFIHWFAEPMTLEDAREFFTSITRGHTVMNGKIYAINTDYFYTT